MKKNILALPLIAFAALLAIAPVTASAAPVPPNAEQMKAVAFLIGTWNCSFSAGGQSGTNISTFTSVMNGAWLQETEAVRTKSGGLYVTTTHFTGYDPDEKRYMHVGPNADGTYEVAYTTDFHSFHTILPAGQQDATFTKVSDTEFSLREPFTQNGQAMVYLNTCKKAP
jgi:hypothetical protein